MLGCLYMEFKRRFKFKDIFFVRNEEDNIIVDFKEILVIVKF